MGNAVAMFRDELVPTTVAAAVVGLFQLLISWFILGNHDTLLRHLPVTIAAITAAQGFAITRLPTQGTTSLHVARVVIMTSLALLVAFCFVTAIATSRGREPIGQPPEFTEWAITLVMVAAVSLVDGYARRRSD